MAHDHPDPTEAHDHSVSERCEEELSGKYEGYIQTHLDFLRAKCANILACIDKLLLDESPLLVLKGENISLNKTCGLLYRTENSTDTEKCTAAEREDIRADIESHLEDQLSDSSNKWRDVKRCLQNSYGKDERTNRVDEVCKLAYDNAELCRNHGTHRKVEDFFNDHIHHLKCTCRSLANDDQSEDNVLVKRIIGTSIGAVLLLIIFILIGCVCYHRRKAKQLKKRSPNVIYLPSPNSDTHPVYQEVCDDGRWMHNSPSNPPSLRYTTHPLAAKLLGQEDEPAYLEPIEVRRRFGPVPPPPISNPGYGDPPRYSERAPNDEDEDDNYFEPIPSPDDAKGNNPKDNNKTGTGNSEGYETVEAILPAIPDEDAPTPSSKPLGPVPAARTKKDDRKTESHYFILEKDEDDKKKETVIE